MTFYRSVGDVPSKRHTQHRGPDGALLLEELVSSQGFSAESSLLYHRRQPTDLVRSRIWELAEAEPITNYPLRCRHFRTGEIGDSRADAVTGRVPLLANEDVALSFFAASSPSPLYRNGGGDECVFVHAGQARVETSYGALEVAAGALVVLPRGTTHRWVPHGPDPVRGFVIAGAGHIVPPARYLSSRGQFLEHSPYCERDLQAPRQCLVVEDSEGGEGSEIDVYVRHGATGSILTYAHHPFDVVGWTGCLYPYALDVRDFEPITGRVHQPPPVHQVFEGPGFVVCAFVPRKVDYHPAAIPSPYYHSNVDSDEVMFYAAGNYGARAGSGIASGSISLHPAGLPHGPQPGAYERSIGVSEVDELAVMVDTFAPLRISREALAIEDAAYPTSWVR